MTNPQTELALQSLKKLAEAGFDKSVCQVSQDELHELQSENSHINLVRTNFETDVRLSAIKDHRRATLAVNKTDQSTIANAIDELKTMAESANVDEAYDIAEKQDKEAFSIGPAAPDYDLMYDRIEQVQNYASERYPSLNLRSVGITWFKRQACFANSNDVQFDSNRSQYRVSVSFSAKEGLDTSSMMYTGYSRFDLSTAIENAVNVDELFRQSTEQVRTHSLPGKFVGDLLIAPNCLPNFLGFMTARLSDAAMISGTSVYKDKLNEQVASERLTLSSCPLGPDITSGYWLSGDGVKAENSTILDNGILRSNLLSIYGANRTGLQRSVNSGGCYKVTPGSDSFDELVRGVSEGVLINRFSGGRPNDRGDFSGIAKNSYYIKDGQIQFPLKETTVSGNMVELLQSINGISKETLNSGASIYPWVRATGVHVS